MQKLFIAILALSLAACAEEEVTLPIWKYYQVYPQHSMLRAQLMEVIHRGDIPGMEAICRNGIQLMPGDATWHYNLACALAYREQTDPALDELERAIKFGFRDADAIAKDHDFSRINDLPRFKKLVDMARSLVGKPVAGRPVPAPLYVTIGANAKLTETNVVFNFDTGVYDAQLQLSTPNTDISKLSDKFFASQPKAPERRLVANWLAEGSAVGNAGDLYVNRDRGHSWLAVGDFPQLTVIGYNDSGKPFFADINHPNTFFGNAPTFGNVSRGYHSGVYWRSMARSSFTEPGLAARMDLLYRSNQFWVLPCINDFGKPELGDTFPANAPWQLVSAGASWSDQPFLRAALAASAAFTRPTKQAIIRRKLMGPTLQWLIRRTQSGVNSEDNYLSGMAHPTAFSAKRLNPVALVEKAHALRPENIPPAVSLSMINSKLFPIRFPVAGRDYPDTVSEMLFGTASAMGFVLRAPDGDRTFLFRAQSFPEHDPLATYEWKVVHGDPSAVTISAPLGETLNNPQSGFAQIRINRRGLVGRIDVACFAKTHNTDYGAPSIISFYALPQEKRVYRKDGKIESIDYSNPDMAYSDPLLALPRRWKDTYNYSADGICLGFTRSYKGKEAASFTTTGDRIVERNPDGTPKKAVHVQYTSRQTGDKLQPVELTYTDNGEPFEVQQ